MMIGSVIVSLLSLGFGRPCSAFLPPRYRAKCEILGVRFPQPAETKRNKNIDLL